MSWKLEIVSQLRPCYVDGVKALFHRWGLLWSSFFITL
jgi:hypothetical protein